MYITGIYICQANILATISKTCESSPGDIDLEGADWSSNVRMHDNGRSKPATTRQRRHDGWRITCSPNSTAKTVQVARQPGAV